MSSWNWSTSCGAFTYTKKLHGRKPIALLAFLGKVKDTSDNCGVCECNAVRVLVYLVSDSAREVYEAYTANEMSTDAHGFHGAQAIVINALMQCFLTKNVPQKAYQLVIRAFQ